ncbi:MAG: hypothetical protein ACYTGS_04010 [Planctomycetota bacterium]|jgi:hypothetical protein
MEAAEVEREERKKNGKKNKPSERDLIRLVKRLFTQYPPTTEHNQKKAFKESLETLSQRVAWESWTSIYTAGETPEQIAGELLQSMGEIRASRGAWESPETSGEPSRAVRKPKYNHIKRADFDTFNLIVVAYVEIERLIESQRPDNGAPFFPSLPHEYTVIRRTIQQYLEDECQALRTNLEIRMLQGDTSAIQIVLDALEGEALDEPWFVAGQKNAYQGGHAFKINPKKRTSETDELALQKLIKRFDGKFEKGNTSQHDEQKPATPYFESLKLRHCHILLRPQKYDILKMYPTLRKQ